ncbi:MAG: response regulator [Deltaproteobacteria bacterium]|nr:response regulator [Deltaproteobacteria bacterium]
MSGKILITDDLSENRYLLETLLQSRGFETISTVNGQEALAAARTAPPDLIVSDILMPVMDGYALCKEWRSDERLRQIPFVFYTATYTEKKDIEFGLTLGADRFLIKPMEPEALLEVLQEVLAESRKSGTPPQESGKPLETDRELLRQHNETLFRKLEKKMADLEATNLRLEREVRERQATEASLRQSEEKLKQLLDTLPVGLVLADPTDTVRYVNRTFSERFGYSAAELSTIAAWFLRACDGPEAGPQLFAAWQKAVATAQQTQEAIPPFDARVICKDGTVKDIAVIGAVVADVHLAILTDMTERRQLEWQLHQAQKLENIGTLAGGIAHDFNNVLTSISGFAGLLQMKMHSADPLLPYVNEIAAAGSRGASLTRQLLAFSRKQILSIRPVDLNAVVTNLQKMLHRLIREDIVLRFTPFSEPLPVLADINQIEQVVINLVTNARDAMPAGGPLEITTGIADIDERFVRCRGYGEIGRYAVLTVCDGGTGMDERLKQQIFEPFFTTKAKDKGTGLGLSVAYGIIRQHRGIIQVESEPQAGSAFTVYLPLLREKVPLGKEPPQETAVAGGSETVLVAEDNEMIRKMTRDILTNQGYKVLEAPDGKRALAAFHEHRDEIDLVVLDLIMPGMGGREAYNEIVKAAPDTRALFVTGYGESEIARQALTGKRLPLLMKPYTPLRFLRQVRELLDEKTAAPRPPEPAVGADLAADRGSQTTTRP